MGTNLEERNEDDELRSKENETMAQREPQKDTRRDSGKQSKEKEEVVLGKDKTKNAEKGGKGQINKAFTEPERKSRKNGKMQ